MDIFNAALGAMALVIVTMAIRDWIRAISDGYVEHRKRRERMKFYK